MDRVTVKVVIKHVAVVKVVVVIVFLCGELEKNTRLDQLLSDISSIICINIYNLSQFNQLIFYVYIYDYTSYHIYNYTLTTQFPL